MVVRLVEQELVKQRLLYQQNALATMAKPTKPGQFPQHKEQHSVQIISNHQQAKIHLLPYWRVVPGVCTHIILYLGPRSVELENCWLSWFFALLTASILLLLPFPRISLFSVPVVTATGSSYWAAGISLFVLFCSAVSAPLRLFKNYTAEAKNVLLVFFWVQAQLHLQQSQGSAPRPGEILDPPPQPVFVTWVSMNICSRP